MSPQNGSCYLHMVDIGVCIVYCKMTRVYEKTDLLINFLSYFSQPSMKRPHLTNATLIDNYMNVIHPLT